MKKFLSLVLALVMTMSLVTVSAGAKDFNDSDDLSGEQYEEAVNVMSEMGIIDGYAGGNFQPQGTLTRGAAAKIIACMMLGKTTAEALGTSAAPFKDVPAGSTFAGYIAYCVESGLIDGYADGTFRPSNTLTGFAFLKMLLTALGYDSAIEGYTGTNWTVNVAGRATQIGLTDGNDDFVGSRAATREEACLYAVNALQTTLVEYDSKGTNVTVNGATVAIGASKPTFVTSSISGAATSIDDTIDNTTHDYTVEFAEKYQPDLEKHDDTDDFMRPAHTWSWKSKEIGTYVDYDLMVAEYTTKVTGRDLYEDLTASTIREYDLTYYVDGAEPATDNISKNELYRNNTSSVGRTGNGVLTQVFVDDVHEEITIVSINTYLAQANANYNSKSESISLQVYNNANGIARVVDVEEVPAIADLQEDDFVLVNWASNTDTASSKSVVEVVDVPEVLTDVTVSKFSKKNPDTATVQGNADRVTAITTGGSEYKNNYNAWYEDATLGDYDGSLLTDKTYDIYMDQYGYFIGAALHSGEDQYVFITAYDVNESAMGWVNADALAIFTDGRMEQIKVNTRDTNKNIDTNEDGTSDVTNYNVWKTNTGCNRWFTYTEDNGVYTLDPAENYTINSDTRGRTIQTDRLSLNHNIALANGVSSAYEQRSFGNEDSVYITVEQGTAVKWGDVMDEVTGVYTGVDSVRLLVGSNSNDYVYAVYDKDNYIIAAIVVGEAEGAVDNYAYVLDGADSEGRDSDGNYYWTFDAVLNGEVQELTIKSKYARTIDYLYPGEVEELVLDADGYVTKINRLDDKNNLNGKYASVSKNEVYDNAELNAGNDVTNFDVYHVDVNGTTLHLDGRTLHLNNQWDQTGLFFASDAKAVVRQSVNGDWSNTEYATVREAYSTLSDADNNTANGLNFDGEVVAVLDANGVAQWVFFYDDHGVTSGNQPNYTNGRLDVLSLTYANGSFSVNTGTKEELKAGGTYSVNVYSGSYVVATTGTIASGYVAAGGVWTDVVKANVGTASGTYRVVVTVTDGAGVVRSGEATFTI